jgi:hypothetical protein
LTAGKDRRLSVYQGRYARKDGNVEKQGFLDTVLEADSPFDKPTSENMGFGCLLACFGRSFCKKPTPTMTASPKEMTGEE